MDHLIQISGVGAPQRAPMPNVSRPRLIRSTLAAIFAR
jgi:hypothetical protein